MSFPLTRGAANACIGNSFRGGVSPRNTRHLRGQSTLEYVLIIALIGLVVVFAGPWIASAIRNQFNTVARAIRSGTTGENFYEPEDIPDPETGTAFAIYSEDDHSLMFYKRRGVPQVGDMFNDRRVTALYTGIETARYRAIPQPETTGIGEGRQSVAVDNGDVCTPWYDYAGECKTVCVTDEGIHPISVKYWFQNFVKCTSFDVLKIDSSSITDISHLFFACKSVEKIDLTTWDTSNLKESFSTFARCSMLQSVGFCNGDFSNTDSRDWMFSGCSSLSLDCSNWNVSSNVTHTDFAGNALGVVPPKAWQ